MVRSFPLMRALLGEPDNPLRDRLNLALLEFFFRTGCRPCGELALVRGCAISILSRAASTSARR